MKYFLVAILGAISFFAPAQVTLPDSVARFYLDRHFMVENLQKRNDLLILLTSNQEKTIILKDSLINNYAKAEAIHSDLEAVFKAQRDTYETENKKLHKELKKISFISKLTAVVSVIALILL